MKIWKDPVWSKVIATVILALLAGAATYFSGIWPDIKNFIVRCWDFLFISTPIQNWIVGIMIISCIIVLLIFIFFIIAIFKKSDPVPTFHSYKSDTFFGLKWHWSYSNNSVSNIAAFCLRCSYQIQPKNKSDHFQNSYEYSCDDCGYCPGQSSIDPIELVNRVELKIQKNIRNDAWRVK